MVLVFSRPSGTDAIPMPGPLTSRDSGPLWHNNPVCPFTLVPPPCR